MLKKEKAYQNRQYMLTNDFEIFHYTDDYLKEVELHHHDFYEIYYFIEGEVTYDIVGKTYNLCSGDILIISPDELHQPIIQNGKYERIVFWISKNYLKELSDDETDFFRCFKLMKSESMNLLRLEPNSSQKLRNMLDSINSSNQDNEFGAKPYTIALVQIFLIELARVIEKSPESLIMYHQTSELISSVIKYIDNNLSKNIMLDDIAKEFYISKFYLSHIFKKAIGTTVYRYITQKRLIFAKELISQGKPIKSVCIECGYQDYSSFFRMFKKEYGITPKEYLKYMKNQ